MTIARTGTYTEDVDLGFFEYGNGAAGGLTVSERSTLIQSATSDYVDTIFGLGENGIGTLTVNDNGRFELLAPISERALFVGMFGATGSASVADNSVLLVEGQQVSGVQIGSGRGSVGSLNVNGGATVSLDSGNLSYLSVGVDWAYTGGGTGTARFEAGSSLIMDAGISGTGLVRIDVGSSQNGTSGSLTFDNSDLIADTGGEVYFAIGNDGGAGSLAFRNGSSADIKSAAGAFSGFDIGADARSDGDLLIKDSFVKMVNRTGETYFNTGRNEGLGTAAIDASTLKFEAIESSGFRFGTTSGNGNGVLRNSARLKVEAQDGGYFEIGAEGGTGSLFVTTDSLVRISTPGDSDIVGQIGYSDGTTASQGLLKINTAARFELFSSGVGDTFINVGSGADGDGEINLESGALLQLWAGGSGQAALRIGRDGGSGTLDVNDSQLMVHSSENHAVVQIGDGPDTQDGSGKLLAEKADIRIEGVRAHLLVGSEDGSHGRFDTGQDTMVALDASGGKIHDAYFGIGYRGGADGQVQIRAGSVVSGVGMTEIGIDPLNRSEIDGRSLSANSKGRFIVYEDSRLESDLVVVGRGGELWLHGGTVESNTLDVIHGKVVMASGWTSELQGNVTLTASSLEFGAFYTSDTDQRPDGSAILQHSGSQFAVDDTTQFNAHRDFGGSTLGQRLRIVETDLDALDWNAGYNLGYSIHGNRIGVSGALVLSYDADHDYLDFVSVRDGRSSRTTLDLGNLGLQGATVTERTDASKSRVALDGDTTVYFYGVNWLIGTDSADNITLDLVFRSTLEAGAGDDIVKSHLGYFDVFGGNGTDTLDYSELDVSIDVYATIGKARTTQFRKDGGKSDNFQGFENFIGSAFNDRLVGDGGDNVFSGGDGNDIIKGKGGLDSFDGGAGDDVVRGGDSIDIMSGGDGADTLLGLSGNDVLSGNAGSDYIYGGRDADQISGGDDEDYLRGNVGGDSINGGNGADDIRGGGNGDILNGDGDNDFILGEGGTDFIAGGSGDDTLFGGFGGGVLDGQRDTFIYSGFAQGAGGFDRIRDFEDGIDVIDLSAFEFMAFADVLSLVTEANGAMRLNFGGGDVIYIDDFSSANFDAGDVIL